MRPAPFAPRRTKRLRWPSSAITRSSFAIRRARRPTVSSARIRTVKAPMLSSPRAGSFPEAAMPDDEKKPFHNPFGALKDKLGELPRGPEAKPAVAPKGPQRAVVRMERKGRGGKEVTVVEQLELRPAELEAWLKALKQSLGCGGVVGEGALVVQGDHRARVKAWLEGRGVSRVSVG